MAGTYKVEVKDGKRTAKTFEVTSHSVGANNNILTLALATGRYAYFNDWDSAVPVIEPEPDPSQDNHKAFAESLTVPPKTFSPGGYIPASHETESVETDSGIFTTGYCSCGEVFLTKEKMVDHVVAYSK